MNTSLRTPRLHIVTGKGGVGKTTVAIALAMRALSLKHRVLLAETNAGDAVARGLNIRPVGSVIREIEPNFFVVDLKPQAAMKEYALQTLRFETLYEVAFENPVARSFVRLVPALAELVMLGKMHYHFEQTQEDATPRFDTLIIDAPATGHAIALLQAPRAVARTVPPGTLRRSCDAINALLKDPNRSRLHIVATPEEMPVTEAKTLVNAPLSITIGQAFVNQVLHPLPDGVLPALEGAASSSVLDALKRRQKRAEHGLAELKALPAILQQQCTHLPDLIGDGLTQPQLQELAALIPRNVLEF